MDSDISNSGERISKQGRGRGRSRGKGVTKTRQGKKVRQQEADRIQEMLEEHKQSVKVKAYKNIKTK